MDEEKGRIAAATLEEELRIPWRHSEDRIGEKRREALCGKAMM
jgi:hypothetical protein